MYDTERSNDNKARSYSSSSSSGSGSNALGAQWYASRFGPGVSGSIGSGRGAKVGDEAAAAEQSEDTVDSDAAGGESDDESDGAGASSESPAKQRKIDAMFSSSR